jgi:hypothetical protein
MKIWPTLLLFLIAPLTQADQVADLSLLNPKLSQLYSTMLDGDDLIGKEVSVDLKLKYASTNHLLFHDAYIRVSADTKYSFLKFEKGMDLPVRISHWKKVRVSFEIIAIHQGPTTSNMPYLEVKLLDIEKQ